MIIDEGGRYRTVRTQDEYESLWKEDLNSLSPEEKETLETIIHDFAAYGKSALFEVASMDLYSSAPVDMETFLDDPYYCGNISKDLFPELKKDLIELFSGCYNEVLLSGGIGAGKSTFSRFCLLRMIYEVSCLADPLEAYGVAKGDKIAFPCISVTEAQAHELVFDKIRNSLTEIPYFKNDFKPEKVTQEEGIFFPKGLWIPPGLSTERRALGLNSFFALIEEVNFFKSIKNTNPNRANNPDMAESIYKSIKRRMESRFLKKGRLPGMIVLISSKTSINSFTERRIKEATNNPNVFIREHSIYSLAPSRYCGVKFRVALGNEVKSSRILADEEPDPEMMKVIEVPIEFRQAFEEDLESSIREISGHATVSITPFIAKRSSIYECIDKTREHPFSQYIWSHDVPGHFLWDKLCKQRKDGSWEPLRYPEAPRFAALDLSKTQDASAIALGCIGPYVSVQRMGKEDLEMVPSFHIDFVLRIEAATHGEIVQSEIRNLIYELSKHGFFIKQVSADSFQSAFLLQSLRQQGYQAKEVSVDRTPGPYSIVKLALYENRISFYRYDPLIRELRELQKNWKTGKIDHPNPADNPDACFTGETLIPLLDGTKVPISELAGKQVWVYSCRPDGQIVPGLARGRKTKEVTTLVEVLLDNGTKSRCTPEHLWMLRNGEYKRADQLTPDDRLMPNHIQTSKDRVRSVRQIQLPEPVVVYDLEVDIWSNFALSAGVFVHNSKDTSDALTQVVFQLNESSKSLFVDVPLMTEAPSFVNDDYWILDNTMAVTNNPHDPRSNTGEVQEEDWKIAAKERLSNAQPQQVDWRNKFQMPFEQS